MRAYQAFLCIVFGALVCGAAYPAHATEARHKALYDLAMVSSVQGSSVVGVDGQMYYEQDDACEAWTSEHRFVVVYQYPGRASERDVSAYENWEGKDGKQFYFNSTRQEDGQQTEKLRGAVNRTADGVAHAVYGRPQGLVFDLPAGYDLPMAHTDALIRHARAGDKFFDAVVFDGTDADGPVEVNTFIGKKVTPAEITRIAAQGKKIDKSLLTPEAWHMHMAFFPLKDKDAMMPAYEMDLILHANGVVSDALVDYKSFKVHQSLRALERLPEEGAPGGNCTVQKSSQKPSGG